MIGLHVGTTQDNPVSTLHEVSWKKGHVMFLRLESL